MSGEDELRQAWLGLEQHWRINPSGKGIPATPLYSGLRLFLSPFLRPILRFKIRGSHNVPRKGACILAANHLSHIDPIMVIAQARRTTHYLAKDGHFKNPLLRTFMHATGQIETHREAGGSEALASAADVLEANRALGIFPEGTRSKRKQAPYLLPGKTGVARLAASYPHAAVVPIAITGSRQAMIPGVHKFPRLWKKLGTHAGVGVTWYEWLGDENGGNVSAQELVELAGKEEHEVRSYLAGLYRKFTDQLMGSLTALGAP